MITNNLLLEHNERRRETCYKVMLSFDLVQLFCEQRFAIAVGSLGDNNIV
jgi:hypothetical protein